MRCDRCPALETEGFEYPLDYCSIGVDEEYRNENAKGEHGCTLHYKTIAKTVRENNELWIIYCSMRCQNENIDSV